MSHSYKGYPCSRIASACSISGQQEINPLNTAPQPIKYTVHLINFLKPICLNGDRMTGLKGGRNQLVSRNIPYHCFLYGGDTPCTCRNTKLRNESTIDYSPHQKLRVWRGWNNGRRCCLPYYHSGGIVLEGNSCRSRRPWVRTGESPRRQGYNQISLGGK